MKKSIKDLSEIKGKRALVRVDVNVPLDAEKNVTDDTRIQAILPTVKFLKEKGFDAFLMGEYFMKNENPGNKFKEFVDVII